MPPLPALVPVLAIALCLSTDLHGEVDPALAAGDPAASPLPLDVSFDAVLALDGRTPDRITRYGPSPSQRLLYWQPRGGTGAGNGALVLLHGGCWLSQYGVEYTYPLAAALADRGYAVWAPEYRRLGEAGGGWPGTFQDIMSALDRVGDSLDRARPDHPGPILLGHSAGGHLALWSAARPGFDAAHPLYRDGATRPRAVMGLAAITDLVAYHDTAGDCPQAVPELMGGSPAEQPGRYAIASPAGLTLAAPVTLLLGSADSIVPLAQARALPGARLRLLDGAGHFDPVHPGTAAFNALLEELETLLRDPAEDD